MAKKFYAFISYHGSNGKVPSALSRLFMSKAQKSNAPWRDKLNARKLYKFLNNKSIHESLRKKYSSLGKHAGIAFWDNEQFVGENGGINESLQKNVVDSKKLVVVCSDQALKSQNYMNFEVNTMLFGEKYNPENDADYFCIDSNGKAVLKGQCAKISDIVPVAFGHEIDVAKVFPCSIKRLDSTREGAPKGFCLERKKDYYKLFARLLGVPKEDVLNSWEQKKRKTTSILAVAAVLCLLLTVGLIHWFMPHSSYYSDYAMEYGVPVGVNKLSDDEAEDVCRYRITTQRGKVREVAYENGYGTVEKLPSDMCDERAPVIKLAYNADKSITYENFDKTGKLLVVMHRSFYDGDKPAGGYLSFWRDKVNGMPYGKYIDEGSNKSFINPGSSSSSKVSNIIQYEVAYDENGREIRYLYETDSRHSKGADENGVWGVEYEFDPDTGLPVAEYYLNRVGERYSLRCSGVRRQYRPTDHRLTRLEFFGKNDEPVFDETFDCAALEYDYYENGSLKSIRRLGISGESYAGTYPAEYFYEYADFGGMPSFQWNLGTDGNRVLVDNFAGYKYSYDDIGRNVFYSTIDKEGNISNANYINSSFRYVYDDANRLVETVYCDENGIPCAGDSYPIENYTYNNDGYRELVEYRNADGELACHKNDEYAYIKYEYSQTVKGLLIGISYFGPAGERVCNDNGIHRYEYGYDQFGNLNFVMYYDAEDPARPILYDDESFCGWRSDTDPISGKRTAVYYLNETKDLVARNDGVAYWVEKYDENHDYRFVSRSYYGADGQRVDKQGESSYSVYEVQYDEYGNISKKHMTSADGKLVEEWIYENDELKTKISDYGTRLIEHFENGNCVLATFVDGSGDLTEGYYGWARQESSYSGAGVLESVYRYGADGERCLDMYGISGKKRVADDEGREIKVCFIGVNDELASHSYYDACGWNITYVENSTILQYFGEHEEPVECKDGYSRKITTSSEDSTQVTYYDLAGTVTKYEKTDEWGRNVESYDMSDGYVVTDVRDEFNFLKERRKTDINGSLVETVEYEAGKMRKKTSAYNSMFYVTEYNDDGKEILINYIDAAGNAAEGPSGWHSFETVYNAAGLIDRTFRYDVNGERCLDIFGIFSEVYEYDDQNRQTKYSYVDTDNNPTVANDTGVNGWVYKYFDDGKSLHYIDVYGAYTAYNGEEGGWRHFENPDGSSVNVWYGADIVSVAKRDCYNESGKLTHRQEYNNGWCTTTYFDDEGSITEKRGFDPDGALCSIYDYGENGLLKRHTHVDADGNPVVGESGYSYMEYEYTDSGSTLRTSRYSADGKRCLDKYGIFSEVYEYDDQNRQTKYYYTGINDERVVANDTLYGGWEWIYGENSLTIRIIGKDDEPVEGMDGWSSCFITYLEDGSTICEDYDLNGQLVKKYIIDADGKETILSEESIPD